MKTNDVLKTFGQLELGDIFEAPIIYDGHGKIVFETFIKIDPVEKLSDFNNCYNAIRLPIIKTNLKAKDFRKSYKLKFFDSNTIVYKGE